MPSETRVPYFGLLPERTREGGHLFELHQLRCFVAVASEMNFSRAAERLNMTQPPLSRQVQLLERAIGVQLFDRSGRNIRLTAGGKRFLVEAHELIRRADEAALAARAAASGVMGTVTIGFVPIAALVLLPRIVPRFRQELPGVRILLREMSTIHQIEALQNGRADLGLIRMPRTQKQVPMEFLFGEGFELALHRSHPYCARDRLELADLNDEDFLMYAPADGWWGFDIFNGIFSAQNIRPEIVQYFGQTLTMMSLVNANTGMALVPSSAREMHFENVVFRPIDLPKEARSEYYVASNPSSVEDPAVQRVMDILRAEFRQDPPA